MTGGANRQLTAHAARTAAGTEGIATARGVFEAEDAGTAGDDDLGEQVQRAKDDPAQLRNLMARYAAETETDRRGALLAILGSIGGDEVMRFAIQQASSAEPSARRAGLELLATFPLDKTAVRDLVTAQLSRETDPGMQAQLVQMLQPVALPREDSEQARQLLRRLADGGQPEVRAASIRQLAQWGGGADADQTMQQALLDSDPTIRQAGIDGVDAGNLRSDRIKDILLDIAGNPQMPVDERRSTLLVLERFQLDRADFTLMRNAADALARQTPGDAHDEGM